MIALHSTLLAGLQRAAGERAVTERRREEERVRKDERRRLGADLHDNLGQHLTGIACLAAALRDQLRREGSPLAAQADRVARSITTAHEVARRLAHGLCPPELESQGLRGALLGLGDTVRRLHPVSCTFEGRGPEGPEDTQVATHLYCIAQEAIANAIRHGKARRIAMRLDSTREPRRLVIEDDGAGFDPSTPAGSDGLGRHLMERRAALIGGQLRIRPLRRGMRVECLFPRAAAHAA
jgi:two-component system, LuxR family, sensor kinase FixL